MYEMLYEIIVVTAIVVGAVTITFIGVLVVEGLINRWRDH